MEKEDDEDEKEQREYLLKAEEEPQQKQQQGSFIKTTSWKGELGSSWTCVFVCQWTPEYL